MRENSLGTSEPTDGVEAFCIEHHKREISRFFLSCKDASHFYQRSLSIARASELGKCDSKTINVGKWFFYSKHCEKFTCSNQTEHDANKKFLNNFIMKLY